MAGRQKSSLSSPQVSSDLQIEPILLAFSGGIQKLLNFETVLNPTFNLGQKQLVIVFVHLTNDSSIQHSLLEK